MYDIASIYSARSVDDAIRALQADPAAVVIAGGTDVLIKIREGKLAGCPLVSIHELGEELSGVTLADNGDVEIGPLTTFRGVTFSDVIRRTIPVLGEAADMAGGPQLRAAGTIGGNVCNGITSADTASTLVALDAVLRVRGPKGEREVPISQWYQGVGKVALAAVGSTSVIVNLTVGIFTGLAAGAVVAIAQHFGARRWDEVHECVHTAMLLSILIGAFFMVTGFVLTPWALRAMGTTEEALPGAILYLRVYFLGMVPNVIYNMGTGVLRAIGDFRRPLYFLMAASLCNIVLDLLLVVVFHMGVAGVAIATICSQLLSAVLVVISLMRS